jgi:phosphate uptake regulator
MRYHRRVQKIGSSLLISLPKEWVIENNIEKGSILLIDINNNNIIIHSVKENKKNELIINYTSDNTALSREITEAYLLGYNLIIINGKEPIPYNDREAIKKSIENFIGLEIIDEDVYNVKAQFLLDESTLEPIKILQRMYNIISGMYKDTIKAMVDNNYSALKIIARRDREVNRQYFLLVRFIRSALLNSSLAEMANLSSIDILDYRLAANLLEESGDSIVELAKELTNIKSRIPKQVIGVALIIEELQSLSIDAFINNNRSLVTEITLKYNTLTSMFDKFKQEGNAQLLNIIYILDRTARYWMDIADLVKSLNIKIINC